MEKVLQKRLHYNYQKNIIIMIRPIIMMMTNVIIIYLFRVICNIPLQVGKVAQKWEAEAL